VLTPPTLVEVLRSGWHADVPLLHPSIGRCELPMGKGNGIDRWEEGFDSWTTAAKRRAVRRHRRRLDRAALASA